MKLDWKHPRAAKLARYSFWFFLVKGLLWMAIPALLLWWGDAVGAEPEAAPALLPTVAVQVLAEPSPPPAANAAEQVVPVKLEEVVVTGTRTPHRISQSPVDVQLITAADIRKTGARDLAELLEREGGLTVTRVAGRGTSIEIQGLSSDQVLVLVNGRRVVGRIAGSIDLTRLKVANIQRVEIVKGPSSALYGSDALGGVVNVITREGGKGGEATLRRDLSHNMDAFAQAGYERGALKGNLNGGHVRSQPYDLDPATPTTEGIKGDSSFFSSNNSYSFSETARLGASFDYSLDNSKRVDGTAGGRIFDVQKRIEEVRVGVAPSFILGENSSVQFDAYYTRYFDQFLQTQRGDSANNLDEETIDQLGALGAQYNHQLGSHALTAGFEAQLERLEANRLNTEGERDRQSLYVQDEFKLLDGNLTLVPGLRYDRDSQFGQQTSPKLALRYNFTPQLFLRASAGTGFRAPDFKQLLLRFSNPAIGYRVEGNPNLRPEKSLGFNSGLTWLLPLGLSLNGTLFHNEVEDLIDIVQVQAGPPTVFSYRNIERAQITGLDLQGEYRPRFLALRPLTFRLGAGYLRSRDKDTGEELSGRAKVRSNMAVEYDTPRFGASLRGVYIGKRVFGVELDTGGAPTGAGKAAAYTLIDAQVRLKNLARFDVGMGLKNITDAGDPRFLPIQPRSAFFEIRRAF